MTSGTLNDRQRERGGRRLDLPPGFTAIGLREAGDAMAEAVRRAPTDGAGTLVYVGRFDMIEFAVVLEPDEPLASARRAIYVVMSALADALAGMVAPERPITFDWPDSVRVDRGLVGGVRLAWPDGAAEDAPPDWLVAGVLLRDRVELAGGVVDPFDVKTVLGTSLELEGVEDGGRDAIIARFCRHLLAHVHAVAEDGFGAIERSYLARLADTAPRRRSLSAAGDLVETSLDGARVIARHDLTAALAAPRWLDPATGEPWL